MLLSASGKLILPRRCEEIEMYGKQLISLAKVLEENPETGVREYRWRKICEDHYGHATGYMILASEQIGISENPWFEKQKPVDHYSTIYDPFAPQRSERDEGGYDLFKDVGSPYPL